MQLCAFNDSLLVQAHIMNDEATRKYLHGVSRLIKGVQGLRPTDPSRSVNFNAFEVRIISLHCSQNNQISQSIDMSSWCSRLRLVPCRLPAAWLLRATEWHLQHPSCCASAGVSG